MHLTKFNTHLLIRRRDCRYSHPVKVGANQTEIRRVTKGGASDTLGLSAKVGYAGI